MQDGDFLIVLRRPKVYTAKRVGLRMPKARIHAVLSPSATAKSLRSHVGICHNILFELFIIRIFSLRLNKLRLLTSW